MVQTVPVPIPSAEGGEVAVPLATSLPQEEEEEQTLTLNCGLVIHKPAGVHGLHTHTDTHLNLKTDRLVCALGPPPPTLSMQGSALFCMMTFQRCN